MPPKAGWSTPMLHVSDISRSIRFYELLGFELIDTEGGPANFYWARLHCQGGAIMLLLAEEPLEDTAVKRIPFYAYTDDLAGLRQHLLDNDVNVSTINTPPYTKSGEITVRDPDGYVFFIAHWGEAEHTDWLKRIDEKKKAGILRPS